MEDDSSIYKLEKGVLTVRDAETGDIVGQSGKWIKPMIHPKYDVGAGDQICELTRRGKTNAQIVAEMGLPGVPTIYHWKTKHPDFAANLKAARQDRGDFYHDQVMEVAAKDIDSKEVSAYKLKTDLYRWGAEKANPGEYGNQTKLTGDVDAPLQIIVDTGIKREGDGCIEGELATGDEQKAIDENDSSGDCNEEEGRSSTDF